MIFTFALLHSLHTTQPQIPVIATEPITIARSYGRSSFSSSRSSFSSSRPSFSSSRPSSSTRISAPSKIQVKPSGITRVSSPNSSKPINITKSVNSPNPTTQLGPKLQKANVNKLKGLDGSISITKSAPPKPVISSSPKTTTQRNTISSNSYQRRSPVTPNPGYYQPAPVYIQQDTSFSNPWMWMYLMDRNNQPQIIQTTPNTPVNVSETPKTQIVTREERNHLKDFFIILLGLGCGIPLGYLIFNKKSF